MTHSEILSHLTAFMTGEAPRLTRLSGYYLGRHDVLRPVRDPDMPDNRLVNNFCRSITDCTVGYFMGRGITYTSADEDTRRMLAAVSVENNERFANNALARDLSVCGRAAELLWYDDVAHPRFTPIAADSVIPVYDESVEPKLTAAIRYFRRREDDDITVEVYDADTLTTYRYNGHALQEQSRTPHLFGEVPVVFYENNRDRLGDFEPVLSLIDAYNRLQSASVNDFELFADSYLAVSGMGGTDAEDLARIRRDRVILLDEGGDAKWLTKTVNDAYIENLKSRIAKDIYRFSGTVDMAEETLTGNTLSGVAIRWRMLNFENRVAVTEQYFRRGLHKRGRLVYVRYRRCEQHSPRDGCRKRRNRRGRRCAECLYGLFRCRRQRHRHRVRVSEMTWEIFCGIVTLCGFGITVGTLVARLASVIARLNASVTDFAATITAMKKENAGDHREIHAALAGHERRITILEEHCDERH